MKAETIELLSFKSPQMRAFHMTWLAFFFCFIAWFAIAPLMSVIRTELQLTQAQVADSILVSVLFTIIARMGVCYVCDHYGPRIAYTALLIVGALPVIGMAFVTSYHELLVMRFLIGGLGASFVITQYHSTLMFAPRIVGTANATTAGWGNLGGGAAQILLPLMFAGFVSMGFAESLSWRLSMVVAGFALLVMGFLYYRYTTDVPEGNFKDLKMGRWSDTPRAKIGTFAEAAKDPRSWILGFIYGACFGIEIAIHNIAPLYFHDGFALSIKAAGVVVGIFGLTNIFARSLGGYIGDLAGRRFGLSGRSSWLAMIILLEGLSLTVFSRMNSLTGAVIALVVFGSFVGMSCGATYSVVPFINGRATASVSGIVGAGGTAGALFSGFLFRMPGLAWADGFLIIGLVVIASSLFAYPIPWGPNFFARWRQLPSGAIAQ